MAAAATAARRRYLVRIALAMAIYVVSLFGADHLIEHRNVSGTLAWALALVPGLAVAGLIWAIGMFILEQSDEFLRMLMIRQTMIATGLALSAASIWGFLEEFELVGHVEAFWIVVVWSFGLLVGALANRITHGTWGNCW